MTEAKKNLIRSIYFYAFAGIGLIMVIIGAFQVVQFGAKRFLLKEYYMEGYESRCDFISQPITTTSADGTVIEKERQLESERVEKERVRCEKNLERERANKQIMDAVGSVSLLALGGAVFVFHYRRTKSD